MQKYCCHCGAQVLPNFRFCTTCGVRVNTTPPVQSTCAKTTLTNAVINKDIHNQKHSVWAYLGQVLILGLMFLCLALGRPWLMILSVPWCINLIKMIRDDVKRSKLKYYVLERPCLEKKFVQGDDKPDMWQLWFANADGSLFVAVSVEESCYNATEVGEEFFVVFLKKDKIPCLCYRKSEWVQD